PRLRGRVREGARTTIDRARHPPPPPPPPAGGGADRGFRPRPPPSPEYALEIFGQCAWRNALPLLRPTGSPVPRHHGFEHVGGRAVDSVRSDGGTAMEMQVFGRTGLQLSVLGFGCGAVGGLMVRGDPLDQERTIARAIAAGVNYFDTAVQYGDGESE